MFHTDRLTSSRIIVFDGGIEVHHRMRNAKTRMTYAIFRIQFKGDKGDSGIRYLSLQRISEHGKPFVVGRGV